MLIEDYMMMGVIIITAPIWGPFALLGWLVERITTVIRTRRVRRIHK